MAGGLKSRIPLLALHSRYRIRSPIPLSPMPDDISTLPRVIATSVIRSTRQGDSHGGVYIVDLARGSSEQVLDWDTTDISWEGRGGDRGLRGIVVHGDRIYMAASDEVFAFDRHFVIRDSFRNPYLRHCHEISRRGERLFLTSTGFDSVLELDLATGEFVRGYAFHYPDLLRRVNRSFGEHPLGRRHFVRMTTFDPGGPLGPAEGDTLHINNVVACPDGFWVSGQNMDLLLNIKEERVDQATRIPYGTHNATPYAGGVFYNDTDDDRVVVVDDRGEVVFASPVPRYDSDRLENQSTPEDHARQGFGRGLRLSGDLLIGGSSPATITAYDLTGGRMLTSVNISMDVRNAVHGLEFWRS